MGNELVGWGPQQVRACLVELGGLQALSAAAAAHCWHTMAEHCSHCWRAAKAPRVSARCWHGRAENSFHCWLAASARASAGVVGGSTGATSACLGESGGDDGTLEAGQEATLLGLFGRSDLVSLWGLERVLSDSTR